MVSLVRPIVLTYARRVLPGQAPEISLNVQQDRVTIRSIERSENNTLLLAWQPLEPLDRDDPVPTLRAQVGEIDAAIRLLVSSLAIVDATRVEVRAITPSLGFLGSPIGLKGLEGLRINLPPARGHVKLFSPIEPLDFFGGSMSDRHDGVHLLAEAQSHQNQLGRFAQLLRLLERAFGRGAGKFDRQLNESLADDQTRHWFERSEISAWIAGRPRVAHADRVAWFEYDVLSHVDRLYEACVDILFNKLHWNRCDSARRDVYVPLQGSLGTSGDFFTTENSEASVVPGAYEPFGSFSYLMRAGIHRRLPPGLWATPNGDELVMRSVEQVDGRWKDFEVAPAVLASVNALTYRADDRTVRPRASSDVA